MKSYTIFGQVREVRTKKGIPNLKVEAWDKDLLFNDLLGSAVTEKSGAFKITFTQKDFEESFFDRQPDLFFKVYKGRRLIASREDSILWNINEGKEVVTIEV